MFVSFSFCLNEDLENYSIKYHFDPKLEKLKNLINIELVIGKVEPLDGRPQQQNVYRVPTCSIKLNGQKCDTITVMPYYQKSGASNVDEQRKEIHMLVIPN